jgi:hypothetical protein
MIERKTNMVFKLFDPTIPARVEPISYVPRPKDLANMKVALVENSKHNSKVILLKIFGLLKNRFNMQLAGIHSKQSPGHGITADALEDFRTKADIAIAGIGD